MHKPSKKHPFSDTQNIVGSDWKPYQQWRKSKKRPSGAIRAAAFLWLFISLLLFCLILLNAA